MNHKLLLFIALFTITIGGIGVDLYSPSLPWIAQYMQVHQALAKYTITTFLIGFAVGQLVFGVFSDLHGRKWVLSGGLLIFVLSSLLAAFSFNIFMLMVLRCIQGVGAASCSVIAKAILTDSLTGKELHKSLTSLSIAWGLGPIAGPFIGGYLQHHYNWQANFYFYAIYSFILLLTVLLFLKETLKLKIERKYSTIKGHYASLLKHRVFMSGIVILGLVYSLIIAFNMMGPFLIQRTLHYGPVLFGRMALIVGCAFFLGSTINRILARHYSATTVIKFGSSLLVIFTVLYLIASYYVATSLWSIVLPTFFIIITMGFIFPNCLSTCMSVFPQIAGIASSLLGCMLYLITTVTSSIFSLIPLSSQRPYAWALMCVVVLMVVTLLFGFFPGVRQRQTLKF